MSDPRGILERRFVEAIGVALGDDAPAEVNALIVPARNPEFGDFQSNAAMPLAKSLGRNPRGLAEAIVAELDVEDIAEPPTVAGPGFINVRLKADALAEALAAMDAQGLAVALPEDRRETIVVDLCGVNLAKQMHVGHLRATVIGDALARLHERQGHTVIRQNHFGDWGLPIAMVVHEVMAAEREGRLRTADLRVADLEVLYREAKLKSDADHRGLAMVRKFDLGPKAAAELEEQVAGAEDELAAAKQTLVELQSGAPAVVETWTTISRITLEACFETCARLRSTVTDEHTAGESTYRDELPGVVEDLRSRGVAVGSEGALIVPLDDVGLAEPCLVRKSDGGFLYATTDLAAIRRRVQELGADRVIYAVDARQSLHFKQVFAAAKKAGYTTHEGRDAELFHASFGTVLGPDNRPLKSRSGENVKLSDLLDEAVRRATATVKEKNPAASDVEAERVAEAVGIGAIKYADLSADRVKDYVFDFDRMLAFEGNTGPYLQYAHVRVRSIFRKAEAELGLNAEAYGPEAAVGFAPVEPEEKALALELLKYANVVDQAAAACEPHRLCTYLFDLAQAFSVFFQACPVLRAPDEGTRDARLRLTALTGRVLADGLRCLGIPAPERM